MEISRKRRRQLTENLRGNIEQRALKLLCKTNER